MSVLRSDWLTQGPIIERFEGAVAEHCGARYAVAFSSGTAALHAAAFAVGVGPGDEVIVPPLSFVATANCIVYQGGRPVFADVCQDTLTLDPEEMRRLMTQNTKAIICVDFAGHPSDLDAILDVAHGQGIPVIEDAAHALGASYKERPVGSMTNITGFSFHPVKHITTGEGGMVLTNHTVLWERLKLFRTHGITRQPDQFVQQDEGPWYYEMQELGYNYRMTDLQCALGLSQLAKLREFVARRRSIAQTYSEALSSLESLILPIERPQSRSSYHRYPIQLRAGMAIRTRRDIFLELRAAGLGVNVHYIPIHLQPYYRRNFGTGPGLCPVAEGYYVRAISLPIYPKMTESEVNRVIDSVGHAMSPDRVNVSV